MRIIPTMKKKEPTYQVVLDALALSPLYPAFLIIAEVLEIYMQQFWHTISKIKDYFSYQFKLDKKKCRVDVEVFRDIHQINPRLPNQEFVEPPSSDEEIVLFIKELGYKGDIKPATEVITNHMHQPWRTITAIINICLSKKTTGLDKIRLSTTQILFTKAIFQHFISKDTSISMRNRLFMHTVQHDSILGSLKFVSKTDDCQAYGALIPAKMTNLKIRNSSAYKTFIAYAIRAIPPNKARKFKKHASLSKKKTLVAVKEPTEKPAKKPAARRQSTGVQIRDTPDVSVSKKKAPAKAERSKGNKLLSKVALLEEAQLKKAIKRMVPDDPKGKSIDTSKGTDSNDDDEQSDDEQTVSNNPRTSNDEEETQEDEYVHTPEDYVPTDDETNDVDDEEYDGINEEMYSDVNVELKDTELEGEGKDDEEMIDAGHVDVEHGNVNQEIVGDHVKDVARATVTIAPSTQKTEVPLQSSSILSDYATKFLSFDNIPSVDTAIISMMEIQVQHEKSKLSNLTTSHRTCFGRIHRISLTGFRNCTSRSRYRSISKQTTRRNIGPIHRTMPLVACFNLNIVPSLTWRLAWMQLILVKTGLRGFSDSLVSEGDPSPLKFMRHHIVEGVAKG
ncbi:hypothetical protein Tco_0324897 [Tanacetum coccineum]